MHIQRIAAFSNGGTGGNPAGVVLLDAMPDEADMQQIAADVGYSETVFAVAPATEEGAWRTRYFSPESEVPFCGHATIALGAALGDRQGPGTYRLDLNDASITVQAQSTPEGMAATLASPPTHSRAATEQEARDALALFGFSASDLDARIAIGRAHGGADHLVIALKDRTRLASMAYDLDQGRSMMRAHGLVTIMLVCIANDQSFDVRNAFASGGVLEDPATGAAAAAFAGYLRDLGWPHGGEFVIRQGEDMGHQSLITARLTDEPGSSVRITGHTRVMTEAG